MRHLLLLHPNYFKAQAMKKTLFVFVLVAFLQADDRSVRTNDFKSFSTSKDIKAEIKKEIIQDLNLTFFDITKNLNGVIEKKFTQTNNLSKKDIQDLKQEVININKALELLKQTFIDANYQRNLRDDKFTQIDKKLNEINKRLDALEEKKQAPLENRSGDKI